MKLKSYGVLGDNEDGSSSTLYTGVVVAFTPKNRGESPFNVINLNYFYSLLPAIQELHESVQLDLTHFDISFTWGFSYPIVPATGWRWVMRDINDVEKSIPIPLTDLPTTSYFFLAPFISRTFKVPNFIKGFLETSGNGGEEPI